MKKNNKGKAKSKTNANTVLNAVGGAVKLKWKTDERNHQWSATVDSLLCAYVIEEKDREYHLFKGRFVSTFKSLAKAKKVAQLIYEG